MYFFDNEFLAQYLEQKVALSVYVDGQYYTIASPDDLDNPTFGVGYTINGKPHTFDYRSIENIKAGSHILTIDQLQDKIAGTEEPEMDSGDGGGEELPGDLDGGGEAPTGGSPDLGGAEKPPPGADLGADEPAPEDEEEPEPPQESARRMVGQMIQESKSKKNADTSACGFSKGNLVENIDLKCEYHGSRGSVTNVTLPEDKNGVAEVEYRVFNYGFNFKPGQKVTKLANQLLMIGNDA